MSSHIRTPFFSFGDIEVGGRGGEVALHLSSLTSCQYNFEMRGDLFLRSKYVLMQYGCVKKWKLDLKR